MQGENSGNFVERRQNPRYQVQYLANVFYHDEDLGSAVIDLSESGAGIVLPREIPEGEELSLKIRVGPSRQQIKSIELHARIVWIKHDDPEDIFRAGLQIVNISKDHLAILKASINELAGKQDSIAGIEIKDRTILVVEDTKALSYILSFDLQKKGFLVYCASSGEEGIEMAKKHQPDLILMDVMLPGINGFEACRRLKADDETKQIPVIILTVKSQQKDILEGLQAGALAYVVKSKGFETIYNKVVETIGEGQ